MVGGMALAGTTRAGSARSVSATGAAAGDARVGDEQVDAAHRRRDPSATRAEATRSRIGVWLCWHSAAGRPGLGAVVSASRP